MRRSINPHLPESKKEEILEDAIGTIQKVAERKAAYYAKYGQGRRLRQFHVIYEAPKEEGEEDEETPPVIAELNNNLQKTAPSDMKDFTVEAIAQHLGVNKKTLYRWVKTDQEFSDTLERLKNVQENDPFKTGTEEDTYVSSLGIAMLLMETREWHYESKNL